MGRKSKITPSQFCKANRFPAIRVSTKEDYCKWSALPHDRPPPHELSEGKTLSILSFLIGWSLPFLERRSIEGKDVKWEGVHVSML